MNNFKYTQPTQTKDAISLAGDDDRSKFIAGGTNIIDLLKYHVMEADALIDVNKLDGHHNIEQLPNGGLLLGAFVTNATTAYHPEIERRYPLLSKTILAGASAQIRNMATNGGNLLQRTRCYYFYDPVAPCNKRLPDSGCSAIKGYNRMHAVLGHSASCIAVYPSDMAVALAALDAIVHIESPVGKRTIPLTEFHRLPGSTPEYDNNLFNGELITGIELPPEGFASNYSYLKLRDRNSYAFALVSVATGLKLKGTNKIEEARIACGGLAHKPWRVKEAEDILRGKEATKENFASAADLILSGAQGFEHNSFKIELARRAIIRNCMMALDPSSQMPGAAPSI